MKKALKEDLPKSYQNVRGGIYAFPACFGLSENRTSKNAALMQDGFKEDVGIAWRSLESCDANVNLKVV